MQRSLLIKILTIVATILVCIYGIIGIPKSKEELIANWNHNIRLGLDLRGGSQLMLQVQVQDAFKAEADQVIDRLKDQLRNAGINYTSLDRNEPASIADASKIEVTIKGLDATKAGNFRSIVTDNFQQWNLTAVNSTERAVSIERACRFRAVW